MIIGEVGPANGHMSLDDCAELMSDASARDIPFLAWTFHGGCPPNLIVDNSGGGCGVGTELVASEWGELLKSGL